MFENSIKMLLEEITSLKASPGFCLGPYPAVSYKFNPISEGPVKQSQLEVRVVGKDIDTCLKIREKIINKFHIEGQNPSIVKNGLAIRPVVSGGGWLFNEQIQMWEYPTIFIVKWRYINETRQ